MTVTLKRQLKGGESGTDVTMIQRALNKAPSQTVIAVDGHYNTTTKNRVRAFEIAHSLLVNDGRFVQQTLNALWTYFDAYGRMRYRLYKPPVPPPPVPVLIEPKQGWNSLVKELWQDFSLGRSMGLSDLGTYNPNSRLPSGAPSDHAMWPAYAFDLGFSPQTGMANPVANKFFNLMVGRPEVHYVICGTSIWSVEEGLHSYTSGGHEGHVHTSGKHLGGLDV